MKIDLEVDLKKYRLQFTGFAHGLIVNPHGDEVSLSSGPQTVPLKQVIDEQYGGADSGSPWFAFWVEDCAFPNVWLVRAESFESAYENFCDTLPALNPSEVEDEDACSRNSEGDPIDTEAVQGCGVELVSLQLRKAVTPS